MSDLHGIKYFYSLAMGICTVIPKLGKELGRKVSFAKQMPTILHNAFVFEKAPEHIPSEFNCYR